MNLLRKIITKLFFLRMKKSVLESSNNVYCHCCESSFLTFLPSGSTLLRANALCPKCNSLERDRLINYFLKEKTDFFYRKIKLLHVAPEKVFYDKWSSLDHIEYHSCVKFMPGSRSNYPERTEDKDLTNMSDEDNKYDVVICSHVLEHIPDDIKAMSEIHRILKQNGWAILQVPLDKSRESTYEDATITDPKLREKEFGQYDHVRVYGLDYKDRLESVGFDVQVFSVTHQLSKSEIFKYGFLEEDVYMCHK